MLEIPLSGRDHSGVGFDNATGRWTAHIGACDYWYSLGTYATEEEARTIITQVREQLLVMPEGQGEAFMEQFKLPQGALTKPLTKLHMKQN
jgi:hypothetical protein